MDGWSMALPKLEEITKLSYKNLFTFAFVPNLKSCRPKKIN
jgi:hypothetical protein